MRRTLEKRGRRHQSYSFPGWERWRAAGHAHGRREHDDPDGSATRSRAEGESIGLRGGGRKGTEKKGTVYMRRVKH